MLAGLNGLKLISQYPQLGIELMISSDLQLKRVRGSKSLVLL